MDNDLQSRNIEQRSTELTDSLLACSRMELSSIYDRLVVVRNQRDLSPGERTALDAFALLIEAAAGAKLS